MTDGDTFKLKGDAGEIAIIRLDQVDAPEKRQAWGDRSKRLLYNLLDGRHLCVFGDKRDKYGRLIGDVHAADVDVNRKMVSEGGAWAYRRYLRDQSILTLESEARAAKRGLWAMPESERVPPWEFRKLRAYDIPLLAAQSRPPPGLETGARLNCSFKPACREMTSCGEAKRWLEQCGGAGIDGDGDGIPCERLCRGR